MTRSSAGFNRLAILGFGLLGGSVARAARERGGADEIVAASRSQEPLREAVRTGTIDRAGTVAEVVDGADLVVLASPIEAMPGLVQEAAPHLAPGALLTDLGSVKIPPCRDLPGLLPAGRHFVGAHPMAGGHEKGASYARSDLFEGASCVVTPSEATPPEAKSRVSEFWEGLGCKVVERSPEEHDEQVAWVSHLPHLVAFAFAAGLSDAPGGAAALVGPGFADFTRIAGGEAGLWSGILSANRDFLRVPLESFRRCLDELAEAIESRDCERQERLLDSARAILGGIDSPGSRKRAQV